MGPWATPQSTFRKLDLSSNISTYCPRLEKELKSIGDNYQQIRYFATSLLKLHDCGYRTLLRSKNLWHQFWIGKWHFSIYIDYSVSCDFFHFISDLVTIIEMEFFQKPC